MAGVESVVQGTARWPTVRFLPMYGTMLAALVFLPCRAWGQSQAPPTQIDLDQAIQMAIAHNHALKAARTLIEQSRAQEITAAIRPNPVLTYDDLFVPISPGQWNSTTFNNVTEFDVGASYTWERGRKRQRRKDAAKDQTQVTQSQVADSERALSFNVAQQFLGVLLAKADLQLAQQDLKSFQDTVDISAARLKAGDISEGDFLKIKLQLLQFQTDVSSFQLALVQARASLRALIGYDALPAQYDVVGELTYSPLHLNREDLQSMALGLRPDLLAAKQGVTAANSQYQLARANGKRDFTTTLDYTHVSAINSASFIFNMEIPIFDRNQGEIARTHSAITQSQESKTVAEETVMTDVTTAYEAVQTGDQIVELYQSGYLKQAQESRDISEYAYKRGAASLLDFLDAERSYRATQLAYRQALAQDMLAVEQLREAVGTRKLP
ncbi:MAG TPA: TolC family protein [Terriglobia bacterium]|nr:TolC family protein [Terriglobia bacterium]